jgi:hypothetical protein
MFLDDRAPGFSSKNGPGVSLVEGRPRSNFGSLVMFADAPGLVAGEQLGGCARPSDG